MGAFHVATDHAQHKAKRGLLDDLSVSRWNFIVLLAVGDERADIETENVWTQLRDYRCDTDGQDYGDEACLAQLGRQPAQNTAPKELN